MTYTPNPVGAVQMQSRSSSRARLSAGNAFFRSREIGEAANLIKIACIEKDGAGELVVHNTKINSALQVSATGMGAPKLVLKELNIAYNEEIVIEHDGARWACQYGQVGNGAFNTPMVSFIVKEIETWPHTARIVIRPHVLRYHLEPLSYTDPITAVETIGWDSGALRATLASDAAGLIDAPARGTDPQDAADAIDTVMVKFDMKNMSGGNGLPLNPAGLNTGPFVTLIHLNYGEQPNGSLAEMNQVYKWSGESSTEGQWVTY